MKKQNTVFFFLAVGSILLSTPSFSASKWFTTLIQQAAVKTPLKKTSLPPAIIHVAFTPTAGQTFSRYLAQVAQDHTQPCPIDIAQILLTYKLTQIRQGAYSDLWYPDLLPSNSLSFFTSLAIQSYEQLVKTYTDDYLTNRFTTYLMKGPHDSDIVGVSCQWPETRMANMDRLYRLQQAHNMLKQAHTLHDTVTRFSTSPHRKRDLLIFTGTGQPSNTWKRYVKGQW